MPDLAVIMSVYYNDKLSYLEESVQSILDQTFFQFHYYIIFDGPVASEIDNYISSLKDERIKLFRLENNEGLAEALNYLLKIVIMNPEYKFIARMDADDISMPTRFEKQRNYLLENPTISVLGSWYKEIDEMGKYLCDRILPTEHETLKKRYYTRTPFVHPSVMYRRELIEAAGFYPTNTVLMEDNILWGNALNHGLKFTNIPEFLIQFRINESFYNRRSGIKYGANYIKARFKILRELKFPFYSFILSFIIGIIKMVPGYVIRFIYLTFRKR